MNGKGSKPRPVDMDAFRSNYDKIFKVVDKTTIEKKAELPGFQDYMPSQYPAGYGLGYRISSVRVLREE